MNYEHKAMELMMTTTLSPITYQNNIISKTTQHTSLVVWMVLIIEKQQYNIKRGLYYLDLVKKHSEESLTSRLFLPSS